jgi:uncharacterized protein (DUF885 family)
MPRLPLVLATLFCATLANAQSEVDRAFETLARNFLAELPAISPVGATLMGDHSADGQLDEVDAAARDRAIGVYTEYQEELAALDDDALSRANKVDARILALELESRLWNLRVLEEWAWNPLLYTNIGGSAIYGLLARDFAPVAARLEAAAARLEELPRFLRQARASLQPARVPPVHAETAVNQNRGILATIDNMIMPAMDGVPPELRTRLAAAIDTARAAIEEHQEWLEQELVPGAAGDFRIGARLYDRKLAFALDSPLDRKAIRARAESEYERVRLRMYEIASRIYSEEHPYTYFPDQPDEAFRQVIIRAALEKAYRHLPPRDGIVEVAQAQLAQATDFVVANNLVEMPDDPLEIIIMPEFQRGVSVAYLDPPGPLDKGMPAFYAVAPLPDDWTDEQVRSFLREYNLYSMQSLTLHEGVPGHFLQIAHSNRYPSTLRSVFWSGSFVEGWAVYAERMMVDAGYLDSDPLMDLVNLKWYLRGIINAIIDSAIHVDGMSEEAAMRLMIEGGFQEEREAAGKWTRARLTSAQLSTYFVGYQEHVAMRRAAERAWGDEFTLRRYHDGALSFGSPPVRYVRALLLDEPIPD